MIIQVNDWFLMSMIGLYAVVLSNINTHTTQLLKLNLFELLLKNILVFFELIEEGIRYILLV